MNPQPIMQETDLEDLDPRFKQQVDNARRALGENPAYAIAVLMPLLERHPGCLGIRKILRQAQQSAAKGRLGLVRQLLGQLGWGGVHVAKDPVKAMQAAEARLNFNPNTIAAYKQLAINAAALQLRGTAALAYEEIFRRKPTDWANVKTLMAAYTQMGKHAEAIRLGEYASRAQPNDDEIQLLLKTASVEQAIEAGDWNAD